MRFHTWYYSSAQTRILLQFYSTTVLYLPGLTMLLQVGQFLNRLLIASSAAVSSIRAECSP